MIIFSSETFLDKVLPETSINALARIGEIFPFYTWLLISALLFILTLVFLILGKVNNFNIKWYKRFLIASLTTLAIFFILEDAYITQKPAVKVNSRIYSQQGFSFSQYCEAKKLFDLNKTCTKVNVPY